MIVWLLLLWCKWTEIMISGAGINSGKFQSGVLSDLPFCPVFKSNSKYEHKSSVYKRCA